MNEMLRQILGNVGWFGKLLQLAIVAILFLVIGFFIWNVAGGDAENIQSQKILQLLSSIFFFLFPALFLGYFWYKNPISSFYLDALPTLKQAIWVVLLMVSIQPFINLLSQFNQQIHLPVALSDMERAFQLAENRAEELTKQLLEVDSVWGYLFNILLMAILPAVCEELMFRGAVQNIFSEKFSKIGAIWITAVIFSLIHFQMYGFFPRMLLGALFGYLLVWTKTLWLPILAHFVNNGMAVSVSYFANDNNQLNRLDELGKTDTLIFGIAGAVISIFILWKIYKSSKKSILIKTVE
ncbi:MAG: type II CAAX prenyl endopeptidase Rce1 family protein [Paludibacteraceae bacterium]